MNASDAKDLGVTLAELHNVAKCWIRFACKCSHSKDSNCWYNKEYGMTNSACLKSLKGLEEHSYQLTDRAILTHGT